METINRIFIDELRGKRPGGVKVWLALLLVLTMLIPFTPKLSASEMVDRIVAIVNDDVICLYDVHDMLRVLENRVDEMGYPEERREEIMNDLRQKVINKLIDKKLTDQELKKYDIGVSEEEIDRTLERMKENGIFNDEELQEMLSTEGLTMEEYREEISDQILRRKLVNREVKSKIVITEEDIRRYYEDHYDEYKSATRYHLRNIIMKFSRMNLDSQKKALRQKMEKVIEKLKQGESFAELADKYSDTAQSFQGGDLGFFDLDKMAEIIREEVKDLKSGEFTPIIETDQGFQIFYVEEVKKTEGKTFEEAREEIEKVLYNQVVDEKFRAWLEDLRKKSHIEIIR